MNKIQVTHEAKHFINVSVALKQLAIAELSSHENDVLVQVLQEHLHFKGDGLFICVGLKEIFGYNQFDIIELVKKGQVDDIFFNHISEIGLVAEEMLTAIPVYAEVDPVSGDIITFTTH